MKIGPSLQYSILEMRNKNVNKNLTPKIPFDVISMFEIRNMITQVYRCYFEIFAADEAG